MSVPGSGNDLTPSKPMTSSSKLSLLDVYASKSPSGIIQSTLPSLSKYPRTYLGSRTDELASNKFSIEPL